MIKTFILALSTILATLWKNLTLLFAVPFRFLKKRPQLFGILVIGGLIMFLYFTENFLVKHSTHHNQTAEILLWIRGLLFSVVALDLFLKGILLCVVFFIIRVTIKSQKPEFWEWCTKPFLRFFTYFEALIENILKVFSGLFKVLWEKIKSFFP
jgi:hypothetical protein